MYKTIVRAKIRHLFVRASEGNFQPILQTFAPKFIYRFVGDTPLGGTRKTIASMEKWWARILILFPGAQLLPQEIVVEGPPWSTRVMTHMIFRASLPTHDGGSRSYENEFMQLMQLKWGRITSVITIEDTQRFVNSLRALEEAGIPEATAAPINDL